VCVYNSGVSARLLVKNFANYQNRFASFENDELRGHSAMPQEKVEGFC